MKEEYRGFEPSKVEPNTGFEPPIVESHKVVRVYVQDHCPKCRGAVQRLRLKGVEFKVVNCMENKQEAIDLGLIETPTIIDTNGKRYVGANAASEFLKDYE